MGTFRLCCVLLLILINACESKKNKYFLYDSRNDNWKEMKYNGQVPDDLWSPNGPVKVIIHGFAPHVWASTEDIREIHCVNLLAREYAKYNNSINIIGVDWRKLAQLPIFLYPTAKENIKPCSVEIRNFLLNLKTSGALRDWKLVHLLGYSMGAHVAAAVGYEIQKKTRGTKIGRITGLDPAGPLFTTKDGSWPDDMRLVLDYRDAELVDIIHTNAGPAQLVFRPSSSRLGSNLQAGHIDFYPNGGKVQKQQCSMYKERINFCSHEMSVLFYASALRRPLTYVSCPCTRYKVHLKGACTCSYPGSGIPLGDLTLLPKEPLRGQRYYITITDPISKGDFSAQSNKMSG